MIKKRNVSILILLILFFFSCSFSSKESNKDMHEKYKAINVEKCTEPFINLGMSTDSAKELCTCLIENAFSLDPSFYGKSDEEMTKFVQENLEKLKEMCYKVYSSE